MPVVDLVQMITAVVTTVLVTMAELTLARLKMAVNDVLSIAVVKTA